MNQCDILIRDCEILLPDFTTQTRQSVAIGNKKILAIGDTKKMEAEYQASEVLSGKDKLLMPGFVDAHTHACQQLLRGKVSDEYPMRWTRFLVPFESNLSEQDVYHSAMLCCLEMIKSGTTSFADAGGRHMHRVADAVIESGMRAAVARSTMDAGGVVDANMKETTADAIRNTEELYKAYQGKGDGRVDIWFAIRQVMTSTPELLRTIGEKAREYNTGIHAHLCEHKDEVSFCLTNYKKRPAAFLDEMGVLGPNLLTAHNVVLSEDDISLLVEREVKIIHCPAANLTSHGFPKTPRLIEAGATIGLGTDGASSTNLSLFYEAQALRLATIAYWGLPVFDPVVLPCAELLKMCTIGGAAAIQKANSLGTIEVGKTADLILLDMNAPHLAANHNTVNTIVESAGSADVCDSIIDGKLVMKNRELLTIDEEKVIADAKQCLKEVSVKAGF